MGSGVINKKRRSSRWDRRAEFSIQITTADFTIVIVVVYGSRYNLYHKP